IETVRVAQRFVLHLQAASLDDSGLSQSQVDALLNPSQTVLELDYNANGPDADLMCSLRLFLSHTMSSEGNYEQSCFVVEQRVPGCKLLRYDAVQRYLEDMTGVYCIDDDLCINSCIAFVADFALLAECPKCNEPRYHPGTTRPRQRMSTYPIGPQIQAMHRHPRTAERMDYWDARTSELLAQLELDEPIKLFDDITCGSDVLTAMLKEQLDPDDTVLIMTMDGAQLYRNKVSGCWMVAFVMATMGPDCRYKKQYIVPAATVPGPHKPEIMESVLFRTLQHISAVNRNGGLRIWDAYRATRAYRELCIQQGRVPRDAFYLSGLYLLFGTADHEAMPTLTGTVKHSGKHSCRIGCPCRGRRMAGGRRGGHYYPMLAIPDNYAVVGCDHPDQPYDSAGAPDPLRYLRNLRLICEAQTNAAYERLRLETGIVKPSPLLGLFISAERPMILGLPNMCPGDNMHLLMNIAIHFLKLWRAEIDCVGPDSKATWDWATLRNADTWTRHGAEVAFLMFFTPTSFERYARNIAEKINSGYKATEWLNYFWVHGPGLFFSVLPFKYWQNYCKLVAGVRIIYQKRIPASQLDFARRMLSEFLGEFEELYIQRKEQRMHFHTQVIHFISHLVDEVWRIGPGASTAQWTMERLIGSYTDELRGHGNPYRNLHERALRRAQVNSAKSICPDLEERCDKDAHLPSGSFDAGRGYVLLRARDRYSRAISGAELLALQFFLRLPEDLDSILKVQRWGGLRLPTGQNARSVWSQDRIKSDKKRDTCNVKLDMGEDGPAFARVRCYFQYMVDDTLRSLAMVEMLGNPSAKQYSDSYGALITAQPLGDDDIRVLDHTRIVSLISL
ncbi:hypothetical protein EXIGLDRAFT_577068, partial [Exidia glandulosa HHB12029]